MSRTDPGAGYASVKERLDQIAEAVGDDLLPLDEALDLFEEAVALGMQVGDLLEDGAEEEIGTNAGGAPSAGAAEAETAAAAANEADRNAS